ncbi:MAG: hypothetical protein V4640_01450 [Verrucomicrobiota bacterium]
MKTAATFRLAAMGGGEDVRRMDDPNLPQSPPFDRKYFMALKRGWKMGCLGIGGVALIAILMLFLAEYLYLRKHAHSRGMTETVNNARQIGIALAEFQIEYGKYPDATTIPEVSKRADSSFALGDRFSNELFAQLMVSGISQSELMFYTRTKSSKKPDNVFDSEATMLAAGECGFAYIMGVDPMGDPMTPLALGPTIPGTKEFDGRANRDKIVVLKVDNSVMSLPIDGNGKVLFKGLDILDPRQSFWNGKAPDVRWPK